MANHKTGAQRYNDRMDKIFERAKELNAKHDAGRAKHVSEGHGDVSSYSSCKKCHGVDDKKKEIAFKMKSGKHLRSEHERLTKEGQTAMDYPTSRTYIKHLEKTGKLVKTKYH